MNFFLHGNEAVGYILLDLIREFRAFWFLGSVSFLTCSAGFVIHVMFTEAGGEGGLPYKKNRRICHKF